MDAASRERRERPGGRARACMGGSAGSSPHDGTAESGKSLGISGSGSSTGPGSAAEMLAGAADAAAPPGIGSHTGTGIGFGTLSIGATTEVAPGAVQPCRSCSCAIMSDAAGCMASCGCIIGAHGWCECGWLKGVISSASSVWPATVRSRRGWCARARVRGGG